MQYAVRKMGEESDLTGRDFVGVSEGDNSDLEITVPYGVSIPSIVDSLDTTNMRFLKTYVKAIQRALSSTMVKNGIETNVVGMKHPLAAVRIVCDFISYGLLVDFSVEEKLSTQGKMWINRTIQRIEPKYINDELIYDEYITQRKRIIKDSFVPTVEGNVINHFMQHGGEILFGSKLFVPVNRISLNELTIRKLRRELAQTFNSRRQSIIRWMIEYIEGLHVSDHSSTNGKWNYAIIASTLWESMILAIYGNQHPVNKTVYGKRYCFSSIETGRAVFTGKPTEHDVIYQDDKQVIIIDAKMYENDKNLLSEEVLGKQFGYYVEAKRKNPGKRVINILFLPLCHDGEKEGFDNIVITDPHVDKTQDPDRIIYLYRRSANDVVKDYYYSQKKHQDLLHQFERFITNSQTREFLNNRGTSY